MCSQLPLQVTTSRRWEAVSDQLSAALCSVFCSSLLPTLRVHIYFSLQGWPALHDPEAQPSADFTGSHNCMLSNPCTMPECTSCTVIRAKQRRKSKRTECSLGLITKHVEGLLNRFNFVFLQLLLAGNPEMLLPLWNFVRWKSFPFLMEFINVRPFPGLH